MSEPKLFLIEIRHRQDCYEHYVFAADAEAAITAYGGPIAERAAWRGFLRAYPVPAVDGGEAMTRGQVLDAIEARIGGSAPSSAPEYDGVAQREVIGKLGRLSRSG